MCKEIDFWEMYGIILVALLITAVYLCMNYNSGGFGYSQKLAEDSFAVFGIKPLVG